MARRNIMKETIEKILAVINKTSNNNYVIREDIDDGKDDGQLKVNIQLICNEGKLWDREINESVSDELEEFEKDQMERVLDQLYASMMYDVIHSGLINMAFQREGIDKEIMLRHQTKGRRF